MSKSVSQNEIVASAKTKLSYAAAPAAAAVALLCFGQSTNAAVATFTTGTALATGSNWTSGTGVGGLPSSTDQATFTDAAYGGPLPATLSNGATQTWGSLIWNSNSSTTISGSQIVLSGNGGTADLIRLGSNMTTGTLTYGMGGTSSFITATTGSINVVNAGATLSMTGQFDFNNTVSNQVITKTGAGTWTFTNGNNGANGSGTNSKFILDQGTLNFAQNNGNMFGGSTSTVLEIHGGTSLDTNGAGFDLTSTKNYAQTWAGDFTFKGTSKALNLGTGAVTLTGGTRQVTVNANTLTVGGAIGDGGSGYGLTKTGAAAGTMGLTGASTYTGATTVNGGTLDLGGGTSTGSLSSSSGLVVGGGTFKYSRTGTNVQTFNGLTINPGASTINASVATDTIALATISRTAPGGAVNFTATGTDTTKTANNSAGIIGGYATFNGSDWAVSAGDGTNAGAISALGSYTPLTSTGDTTTTDNDIITGNVTLGAGKVATINSLKLNGNNAVLANGGNAITVGGSGSGGLLVTQNATISGTGTVGAGAANEFIVYNSANLIISSKIIGNATAGGLTKSGSGTMTLSGSNNYTGATYVNGGTLVAGVASTAFSASSAVIVGTGGTLGLNNFSNAIGSLASNNASGGGLGSVTLGTATLTTGGDGTSTTFNGVISGVGGALTKTGAGVQTLTGINTYTGATSINNGTLLVDGSLASGSAVSTSGTGMLGGSGIINGATTIATGTKLSPGDAIGTLTFTGGLNISGATADNAGEMMFTVGTAGDKVVETAGTLNIGTLDFGDFTFVNNGIAVGNSYLLFDATGAVVSGSIGSSTGLIGAYSANISLAGNQVYLNVTAVPEPATLGIIGLGALGLLGRRRRS